MNRLLTLRLLISALVVSETACCPRNMSTMPPAAYSAQGATDVTAIELYGYANQAALASALETEISRRAFKRKLQELGLPSNVALNSAFEAKDTEFLLALHANLSVYGSDDRLDPALSATALSRKVERNLRSTAAMFPDTAVNGPISQGMPWTLKDPAQQTLLSKGVCKDQPFASQPAMAECTAFLIDQNIVATAGHCVRTDYEVKGKLFLFDFAVKSDGTVRTEFTDDQVFRGKKLLGRVEVTFGEDWTVVEIDRNVPGRDPLPIRTSGSIPDNEPVYMVGYPSGLPVKIAGNAAVVRNDPFESFFVANLDGFRGNSGSPVFSMNSHDVEGIFVRGEIDYFSIGDCDIPKKCPNDTFGCKGESATRVTLVKYKP